MDPKQQVYNQLAALKIPYEVLDHPPVHTIEDMEEMGIMAVSYTHLDVYKRQV